MFHSDGVSAALLRGARMRRVCGTATLALFVAVTPVSASGATGKVVVASASASPLVVKFSHDTKMKWQGRLDLIVQNESDHKARIRLRFYPEGASQAPFVAIGWRYAGEGVLVRRAFPRRSRAPRVAKRARTHLALEFSIGEKTPLRNASGTLVIELVEAKPVRAPGRPPAFASTFVRTKAVPAANVTFHPAPVKMAIVRRVWLRETTGTTFQVALRGEGLNELAEGFSREAASTRLHSDSGESVQATIRDMRATGDDAAEATVELAGIEHSGSYKGKFPLLIGAQGAQLDVTVDVQVWFWWALLLVGLGVLTGWFVTHAAGLRRQKDVLRAWLIARIQSYEEGVAAIPGRPASFALDDLLGPEPRYGPRVHCGPFPSGRTARELLCRIAQARSDEDLKEDTAAAAAIIEAIDNWLEIEPPAGELQRLTETPPADRGAKMYIDTPVGQDAEAMLAEAGERPANADAASRLADRLRLQAEVWALGARLWELTAELEQRKPGLNNAEKRLLAANKVEKFRTEHEELPTRAELRRVKQKIQRAIGKLQPLRPAEPIQPEAEPEPDLPTLIRIFDQTDALVATGQGDAAGLGRSQTGVRATMLLAFALIVIAIARFFGRIGAFFKAIARNVGRGVMGALQRMAGVVQPDRDSPRRLVHRWTRRDVVLTLIAAAVATIAYTITVYDSTWGTRDDYLSAFAAGFLGKVGIDWADQYISRSLRIARPSDIRSAEPQSK